MKPEDDKSPYYSRDDDRLCRLHRRPSCPFCGETVDLDFDNETRIKPPGDRQ